MTNNRNKALARSGIFITCVQTALVTLLLIQTNSTPPPLSEDDLLQITTVIESQLKANLSTKAIAVNQHPGVADQHTLTYEDLTDALRAVLANELASHRAILDDASPSHATTSELETTALSSQQQEAITQSTNMVEQAIASGAWTKSDTSALMDYILDAPIETRDALHIQFYTAFNQQKISVEDFQFPSF